MRVVATEPARSTWIENDVAVEMRYGIAHTEYVPVGGVVDQVTVSGPRLVLSPPWVPPSPDGML